MLAVVFVVLTKVDRVVTLLFLSLTTTNCNTLRDGGDTGDSRVVLLRALRLFPLCGVERGGVVFV
jgi:hypothetical protein